jgi:aminopeptidase N
MEDIEVVDIEDNWKRTTFNDTPIMSTYILAFVVCDFDYVSTTGPNGLKVNIRATFSNTKEWRGSVLRC